MNMTEANVGPMTEGVITERAKVFDLDPRHIEEMPDFAKKLLFRLDKLGNAKFEGKRVSMLDESIMSAALIDKNPELVKSVLGCEDSEVSSYQRDLIRGSLLSDLGKVESEEMIWLYHGINFDPQKVKARLGKFLEKRYGKPTNIRLMELPYSVAVDFFRDVTFNGSEEPVPNWDESRRRTDSKFKELGFRIKTKDDKNFVGEECTLHDVMTGAHLAVLPSILEKCGIADDPEWQRAIFIAKNHHLSRGLVDGLPHHNDGTFLENILPNHYEDQTLKLRSALLEEVLDMTFASIFRPPRPDDTIGLYARLRVIDNLKKSIRGGRINRAEGSYLSLLIRRSNLGAPVLNSVVSYVESVKDKR